MNALELADMLEKDPSEWGGLGKVAWPAAAMLRTQHTENESLLAANRDLIDNFNQLKEDYESLREQLAARVPDGFVPFPVEHTIALLRPFYACPTDELHLAWQAMHMVAAKQLREALASAPQTVAQPAQRLTGFVIQNHIDPLTGASIPDPTTFGSAQPEQPVAQPDPHCWKHGDEPKNGCDWCEAKPVAQPEQPAVQGEPVGWFNPDPMLVASSDAFRWVKDGEHTVPLFTHPQPEQPAVQGEPVAWLVCSVNKDGSLSLEHAAAWEEDAYAHINKDAFTAYEIKGADPWVVLPAFTHPQPERVALTDEQISNEAIKVQNFGHIGWEGFHAGVRFAEQFHGIKGAAQ